MVDETNIQEDNKGRKGKRVVKRVLLIVGASVLSLVVLLVSTFFFLLYSPWTHAIRDRYVLMTYKTSNPWLCTWFFSQETIDGIFDRNGSEQPDGSVDTSIIMPAVTPTQNGNQTPNPSEPTNMPTHAPVSAEPTLAPSSVPTPYKDFKTSQKYKGEIIYDDGEVRIVEFSGETDYGKYTARMMQIKDPSRVTLGVTNRIGERGQILPDICKTNDALCGINAGGFVDEGGVGNGGTPLGVVVKDGVYRVYTEEKDHKIIGFNRDNVLVIGEFTEEEIASQGIRDAMSWRYPVYLMLNGEVTKYYGLAGGYDPRSAIGQCADGTVLLLVADGSSLRGFDGVNFAMMADMMYEFGAVNAANLDGGTSSCMVLKGNVINTVCNPQIAKSGRWLATAWIVKNQ